MSETPITFPVNRLRCGECGELVTSLRSFAVSVPVDSKLTGMDFCSVGCLMDWAISQHEADLDRLR